jgi:hypothetical protein
MKPAGDKQESLGRAFLQDAYLIADYGREKFYVSKAKDGGLGNNALLKPIFHQNLSSDTFAPLNNITNHPVSKAAVAGIVAGTVIPVVLAALAAYFFCLRRRRTKARLEEEARLKREAEEATLAAKVESPTESPQSMTEISTSESPLSASNTVHGRVHEADSSVVHESGGSPLAKPPEPAVELPDSSGSLGGFYWKDGEMLHEMQGTPVHLDSDTPESWKSGGSSTLYGSSGPTPPHAEAGPSSGPPAYSAAGGLVIPGSVHRSGSPPPASPIPQTPLEFYGPVRAFGPGGHTRVREDAGQRGWIGRAPGLPEVTLTPATPATPTAAPTSIRQLLEPINERRPPIEENKWPADEKKWPIGD